VITIAGLRFGYRRGALYDGFDLRLDRPGAMRRASVMALALIGLLFAGIVVAEHHDGYRASEAASALAAVRAPVIEPTQVGIPRGAGGDARTDAGTISLLEAERIGEIVLELGADADYDLGGLHGPPRPPTLRPYAAAATGAETAIKVAPADPPAEPPRAD
jgi:hypothetical protein